MRAVGAAPASIVLASTDAERQVAAEAGQQVTADAERQVLAWWERWLLPAPGAPE